MKVPTARSTDTDLLITLAWGAALDYGNERTLVCIWLFASLHIGLSISMLPVLTNGACAN